MNFSISIPVKYYSLIGSIFTYQMSPQTQELFGWDLLHRLVSSIPRLWFGGPELQGCVEKLQTDLGGIIAVGEANGTQLKY